MAVESIPDDDAEWLDALQRGDSSKHRDAVVLRKALEQRSKRLANEVPIADERMYSELRFRLRRERLLTATHASRSRLIAAAASIVAVVGITFVLLPNQSEEPEYSSMRSTGSGGAVLATDPELEAQALVQSLKASGISADLRRENAKVIVLVPATLDAIDVLDQLKLPSSRAGNQLEVSFQKKKVLP